MQRHPRERSLATRLLGARAMRSSAAVARLAPVPIALWVLLPLNALALLASLVVVSSPYPIEFGSLLLAAMTTLNAVLGATIAFRLTGHALRPGHREHVRLLVDFEATLGGVPVRVLDISLGGALVVVPAGQLKLDVDQRLEFTMQGVQLHFVAEPTRTQEHAPSAEVALRFIPGQDEMIARLGVALLTEVARDETLPADSDDRRRAA